MTKQLLIISSEDNDKVGVWLPKDLTVRELMKLQNFCKDFSNQDINDIFHMVDTETLPN